MTPTALEALCAAVENVVADEVRISTETADVFVRESLFPVAVSSSQRRLKAAARDEQGIVAWGNTNTQVCTVQLVCLRKDIERKVNENKLLRILELRCTNNSHCRSTNF